MNPTASGKAFRVGLGSLKDRRTAVVLVAGVAATYLVHHQQVVMAEPVFAASVTVLVFLLPAAAAVGPLLSNELNEVLRIVARHSGAERESVRADMRVKVNRLLDEGRHVQRGFTYCMLAVVLAAIALLKPRVPGLGAWPEATTSAMALVLLVGTAFAVFPMTIRLLEFEVVRMLAKNYLSPEAQASAATGPPAPEAQVPTGTGWPAGGIPGH